MLSSSKTSCKGLKAIASSLGSVELSRQALDYPGKEQSFELPEVAKQKILSHAWVKALGIQGKCINLEANFLGLGGNSVSTTNPASHLRSHEYVFSVGEVLGSSNLGDIATCAYQLSTQEPLEQQMFERYKKDSL